MNPYSSANRVSNRISCPERGTGTLRLAIFHNWLPITDAPSASRLLAIQNRVQSRPLARAAAPVTSSCPMAKATRPISRAISPLDMPYRADHSALLKYK